MLYLTTRRPSYAWSTLRGWSCQRGLAYPAQPCRAGCSRDGRVVAAGRRSWCVHDHTALTCECVCAPPTPLEQFLTLVSRTFPDVHLIGARALCSFNSTPRPASFTLLCRSFPHHHHYNTGHNTAVVLAAFPDRFFCVFHSPSTHTLFALLVHRSRSTQMVVMASDRPLRVLLLDNYDRCT